MLPGFTSSIWGAACFARNFGLLTLSAFIGTPIFTYLYATVAQAHTQPGETICKGTACYSYTIGFCQVCASIALVAIGFLWRRWQGQA